MAESPLQNQSHLDFPLPVSLDCGDYPWQSGITDPMWPEVYPETVKPASRRLSLKQKVRQDRLDGECTAKVPSARELKRIYELEYAGRVARQHCQHIVRADVLASSREDLKNILKLITEFIREEMERRPSQKHLKVFEPIPDSYRVTVTLGFGSTLFVDNTGFDRFGLRSRKPRFLKPMPSFDGDAEGFKPEQSASDLILVIASDHPYVNVAVVRFFAEYFNKRFSERFQAIEEPRDVLKFKGVEAGFARKDKREFLRFDDGIQNLQMNRKELQRLVYVDESDAEPPWCLNGSYLVYRKIRERMSKWEAMDATPREQEKAIGRNKKTGRPLSHNPKDDRDMTPFYVDPKKKGAVPLNAHIHKVQPRRPEPDLFGMNDLERQFLRRPYPFFDGLDECGKSINGLHFMAFMKSIQRQFEHIVNMWQMNPDFPVSGTGPDALYALGILSTIDGGYYFCPPGLKHSDDFLGSGLFDS